MHKLFQFKTTTAVREEALLYTSPQQLSQSPFVSQSLQFQQPHYDVIDKCVICLELLDPRINQCVRIKKCGHSFHKDCLFQNFQLNNRACAICRELVAEPQGGCPSGTMKIKLSDLVCPGFEPSTLVISITYLIPEGVQACYHENPGEKYWPTIRKAFLPNNKDGRQLLQRIKFAWMHGMIFSIKTSLTTQLSNSVVWNSINHKTSLNGGHHGFPDPDYINRCNEALNALGVPRCTDDPDVTKEVLQYTAPATLFSDSAIDEALESVLSYSRTCVPNPVIAPYSSVASTPMVSLDKCVMCSDLLVTGPYVKIRECSHYVHHSCIEQQLLLGIQSCPLCGVRFGEPQGRCPSGVMEIRATKKDCPGFFAKAIEIKYSAAGGIQMPYHPNPNRPYFPMAPRTAYIPQTVAGCQLLQRLKYAWLHGLVFSVGVSQTTGRSDSVVWASIPHKTSLFRGTYGYPDPEYLGKCNEALDALGVPNASDCHHEVSKLTP